MQHNSNHSSINRIGFVGNYLPRQCGIATFTTDLCEAIANKYSDTSCIALPVNDIEAGYAYPPRVRFELAEKDIDSYRRAADWPFPVHTVFSPAAALLPDGTTLLLCRVEDRRGLSHLCVARSANGVDASQIDSQPTLSPDPDRLPEELWGIEDPRVTYVPDLS
jgi:hypothetical protein